MKQTMLVPTKVEVDLGPAMQSLPPQQRLFAITYIHNGGDGAKAARAAGYSDAGGGCRSRAYEFLRAKRMQMALQELGAARFAAMGPQALDAVGNLVMMPEHKDHFAATKYILGQAGHREVKEVEHVPGSTPEQKIARIMKLAAEQGLDPKVLLGENAIDVEFETIDEHGIPEGEEY